MADPLPPFDQHGNLPAGQYGPTRQDFESRFVNVANSTTRSHIYEGWAQHRTALQTAGVDHASPVLLDGSYVTGKRDPGDLDLAVEVDADLIANTGVLLAGPAAKPQYRCDAYAIPVYPSGSAEERVTLELRAYWQKWFGKDRSGNPKGFVLATVGGLP